jgi:hypothetical protein
MADLDDPWEEPTKREPRDRALAIDDIMRFYRGLSEVQLECGRLCVALERRDAFGLEFAASRLAAAWRAARATIGLVEVPQIELVQRHVAQLALQACGEAVKRLFAVVFRASERMGDAPPGLPLLLRRLCDELGVASIDCRFLASDNRDAEVS